MSNATCKNDHDVCPCGATEYQYHEHPKGSHCVEGSSFGQTCLPPKTCSAGHERCPGYTMDWEGVAWCCTVCKHSFATETDDHCRTCGTPIGQDCKEGAQEDNAERLSDEDIQTSWLLSNKRLNWIRDMAVNRNCRLPGFIEELLQHAWAVDATIRAKDEEINSLFKHLWASAIEAGMDDNGDERTAVQLVENISADLNESWRRAESAEAKVTNLAIKLQMTQAARDLITRSNTELMLRYEKLEAENERLREAIVRAEKCMGGSSWSAARAILSDLKLPQITPQGEAMNKIEVIGNRAHVRYSNIPLHEQDEVRDADIKWLREVVEEAKQFAENYSIEHSTGFLTPAARALLAKINEEEETPNAKR